MTESYLSLRRLENDILRETVAGINKDGKVGAMLGFQEEELNPIKINIQQFYGIEINDFAVSVAKTAMWIAEAQMFKETESIIQKEMDFLPLHNNSNIHEGNALQIDWKSIIDPMKLSYIIGNPPFVGAKYSSSEQKKDMDLVYKAYSKKYRKLDYVTSWYVKASELINQNNEITVAFVSTNSVTQGEQVGIFWSVLEKLNIDILFAYRSFKWSSESFSSAAVHCIILAIKSNKNKSNKYLFSNGRKQSVENINGYLLNAPTVKILARRCSISENAPKITKGSQPTDGGNLILSEKEANNLKSRYPYLTPYIRRYMGAVDYINDEYRYCLWLKDCNLNIIKDSKEVMNRIRLVRESRLASKKIVLN